MIINTCYIHLLIVLKVLYIAYEALLRQCEYS